VGVNRVNHVRKHVERIEVREGGWLILFLALAITCNACRYSRPALRGTSQPTATAWPALGGVATILPIAGGGASESATTTPLHVATPAPTPTARAIRVVKVPPIVQVTGNEQYDLNNCSNSVPLRQPFSDAAQISTEVAVSDQAARPDGTLISVSEAIRSELGREVELAYQDALGASREALDASEMMAPPFTRWYVTVIWEDWVFAGSVSFRSDSMTAMATYTYTQHVPKMGSIQPQACTP
jgi:hypothetical protein